ncbi:MAG: hypothetical protein QXG98_05920 [Candidatus Micrarchaeia archaeon]
MKRAKRRARPFFSLETTWDYAKLFLVLVVLILLGMMAFVLWPTEKGVRMSVSAEPLLPNAALNLSPGERFVYNVSFGRESTLVEFEVADKLEDCLVVRSSPMGEGCIAANGSLVWGNISGFFERWMLALAPNWSWRVRVRSEVVGIGMSEERVISYTVSEVAERRGRRAFHVLVASPSGVEGEIWVDAERRILLAMNASGLRAELVRAPFPLASP